MSFFFFWREIVTKIGISSYLHILIRIYKTNYFSREIEMILMGKKGKR